MMRKLGFTLLIVLLASLSAPLAAAPVAFSVNSDSGTATEDSLYEIDLGENTSKRIGPLSPALYDVEGLAFAPGGTLYAIDDESLALLPLDFESAVAGKAQPISGLANPGANDFGMTFGCDGTLYVTSVIENKLFSMDLSGNATPIGMLGVNISAIAAWGEPTELYGLGNGLDSNQQTDAPGLYRIDTDSGAASLIGVLGAEADPYNEGGLDFDESGQLWAITDRRVPDNEPSQVLRVDKQTGKVIEKKTLTEIGFESLAIAPPAGCDDVNPVDPPGPLDPPGVDEPPGSGSAYRSVPVMHPVGLALAALLLLVTGLAAVRRF